LDQGEAWRSKFDFLDKATKMEITSLKEEKSKLEDSLKKLNNEIETMKKDGVKGSDEKKN